MLDEATKAKLAAMSPDEWRAELALGPKSRYGEDKRAHMRALLAVHDARDLDARQQEQVKLTVEANEIARAANTTSKRSFWVAVFAAVVAVAAVAVEAMKK